MRIVRTVSRLARSLSGGGVPFLQVQALIQGRASAWQQNLVLTPTKAGAGEAVSPHSRASFPFLHIVYQDKPGLKNKLTMSEGSQQSRICISG